MKSIAKLFTSTPTSAATATALEAARAEVEAALAAVETAESDYQAGLLTEEPAALRKLVDRKTDQRIVADIAAARVAKLERQLESATANEAEAARRKEYETAKKLTGIARARLADYREAAETIRDVLRSIAEAETQIQLVNADLPEGSDPLPSAEASRSVPRQWREVISEKPVRLWSGTGERKPLPEEMQDKVVPIKNRHSEDECGTVWTGSGHLDVVLRDFKKIESFPDYSGWLAVPLATEVSLPALDAGATPFWEPTTDGGADVIRQLAKPLLARPEAPARVPTIEYK